LIDVAAYTPPDVEQLGPFPSHVNPNPMNANEFDQAEGQVPANDKRKLLSLATSWNHGAVVASSTVSETPPDSPVKQRGQV
jgi:hypothetical protein